MKKILIILLTLNISLYASISIQKLHFESGLSIYGKIGFVDVILEEDTEKQTYKMQAIAKSIGIVKVLSGNRTDHFISEGKIENGVYVPHTFTKKATKTDYEKSTTYSFDYRYNTVVKNVVKSEYVDDSTFDPFEMRYVSAKKLVVKKDSSEIKLYPNDYLSLYLNLEKGNLKNGVISYVDKKEKDRLLLHNHGLIEVQKNHGEDKYNIIVDYDDSSRFFNKVESIGVAFYGDAYIKKISDRTKLIQAD